MPRYYDDNDYDDLDISRRPSEREHDGPFPQSGLGISSLLMSIGCGVVMFALIAGAIAMAANQNGPPNDKDPVLAALGLGIIATTGFTLIGLVLGIVGCFQPNRGSLCGILGSTFNALLLLGVSALMCIGLLVGG